MDNVSSTMLGVGAGVLILAVVWVAAFVLGIMQLRASGSSKLGVIRIFLLALIITLALVFFPRSPEHTPAVKEIEIVDTLFIGRYVLLALASLVFLVTSFMLIPIHFLEPVYAKALKTH